MIEKIVTTENAKIIKDSYISLLKSNILDISFKKKSTGEPRVLVGTLISSYLPPLVKDENKKPKKSNDFIVNCWDVEKGAWRSFDILSEDLVITNHK